MLPAELIVKNFIKGEPDCNCENYMLEFINQSSFFTGKSLGETFARPPHERNKQCDYISDNYSLDLKLLVSQSMMQGISELSAGKQMLAPGVVSITAHSGKRHAQQTLQIYVALRQFDLEQLVLLRNKVNGKSEDEKEIVNLLKKLETEKNLLLFFPYCFRFDNQYAFRDGVTQIEEAINSDFRYILAYRNSVRKEYDTFLAFLYDGYIVFMQDNDNSFAYADSLNLESSPIFMKLASTAHF